MKCRQIQKRMVGRSGKITDHPLDREIEIHLAHCADCRAWLDELEALGKSVRSQSHPSPSPELVMQTLSLCHARIAGLPVHPRRFRLSVWTRPIPGFIKWVLPPLVFCTFGWILSTIGDLKPDVTPTTPAVIGLVLIVQNAAMLLFAPILLRRRSIQNSHIRFN